MIRSGPFSKANRIAAWILAAVCVIAGLIGMGMKGLGTGIDILT
jgi:hypothetical protein